MSKKKSNRIFDCAIELDLLAKSKTKRRRAELIKNARNCVIDSISEIALNCLKGNIPIKNCDFKKLKVQKKILRKLTEKSPVKNRRRLIIQKGGFLPILISTALGFLGTVAADYLKNKLEK